MCIRRVGPAVLRQLLNEGLDRMQNYWDSVNLYAVDDRNGFVTFSAARS